MLPVAAKLKAFWDRLVDHTDPEAAFKATVTEALQHLEQRIEEVAKGALPADVDAAVKEMVSQAANSYQALKEQVEAHSAQIEEIASHATLSVPPLVMPTAPNDGKEPEPATAAAPAASETKSAAAAPEGPHEESKGPAAPAEGKPASGAENSAASSEITTSP